MRTNIPSIARILSTRRHYASVLRSHIYLDWREFFLQRYVLGQGEYPYRCRIRTPMGTIALTLYGTGDAFTVQEIFGLDGYLASNEQIIVDFGSNIGISAAYFLTRNPTAKVYCFEPLPENYTKLIANLQPFAGRYELMRSAVTDREGTVSFFTEPSGRLSGFDCTSGDWREFPCVSAEDALCAIADTHGRIDLLKVDIEGAEKLFMQKLSPGILSRIGRVYIEGQQLFELEGFRRGKTLSGVDCYCR
jgi:FkbM family methyltransferase